MDNPEMRPADFLFPGRREALEMQVCMSCKEPAIGFKDAISRKEYAISALCQDCQDSVFEGGEEW